jgi:hypothetical protein
MNASLLAFMCISVLGSGCVSRHSLPPDDTYEQRRIKVADIEVPLPTLTPYDSDQDARKVYLSAYHDGYKTGLTGFTIRYLFRQQPHLDALISGCYDGQKAGLNASPYRLEFGIAALK